MQKIETNRLILRPFVLEDAKLVQKYAGDFSVADTTLNIPHPYEDGMAEAWISTHKEKYDTNERITYAITVKPNNEILGAIGLTAFDQRFNIYEIGYWIGKPFWNKGICTEATKALIHYGFKNIKAHKIIARHFLRNPSSGRVLEKVGMELEGTFKDQVRRWEVWETIKIYGITKNDWTKLNNQQTEKPNN